MFTDDKLSRDIVKLCVSFGLGGALACIRLEVLITHLKKYSTYFDQDNEYIEKRVKNLHGTKNGAWRITIIIVNKDTYIRVH